MDFLYGSWTECFNHFYRVCPLIIAIVSINLWFVVECGVKAREVRYVRAEPSRESVRSKKAQRKVSSKSASRENSSKVASDLPLCSANSQQSKVNSSNVPPINVERSLREDKTQVNSPAFLPEDKTQTSYCEEPSKREEKTQRSSRSTHSN